MVSHPSSVIILVLALAPLTFLPRAEMQEDFDEKGSLTFPLTPISMGLLH